MTGASHERLETISTMKFSIIVPVYKVEKYLRSCVESILGQTYKDFELILVDDGSPDASPQICDEYAQKYENVRCIHQKNGGQSCARNTGLSVASGKYIMFIDSDDYLLESTLLQRIADKTRLDTDVIMYGFQKFFESTGEFGQSEVPILGRVCTTSEMLQNVLASNTYCGTAWTKAVRLDLLRNNNIEFKSGMISEDIDWYMQVLCHAKTFDSINGIGVVYRQREDSISHAPKLKSLEDNLWILENWPAKFVQDMTDRELLNSLMSVMAYYYTNDLILYTSYSSSQVSIFKERLKNQSCLLQYAVTPRAKIVKKVYSILGFGMTVSLLKVLGRLKTRS